MSEKLRTMLLLVAAWELVPISTGLASLSVPFCLSELFMPMTMLEARLRENVPILVGAGTLVAFLPQVHTQLADPARGDFLRQYGPPESFVVLRLWLQSVLTVIIALLFLFLALLRLCIEGRLAVKLDEEGVKVFNSRGKARHIGWGELHSVRGPTCYEVLLDGGLVLGTAEGEIPLDVHVGRQDELLLALQGRLAEQQR